MLHFVHIHKRMKKNSNCAAFLSTHHSRYTHFSEHMWSWSMPSPSSAISMSSLIPLAAIRNRSTISQPSKHPWCSCIPSGCKASLLALPCDGWTMMGNGAGEPRPFLVEDVVWHSLSSPQCQTVFAFCLLSALSSFFLRFFWVYFCLYVDWGILGYNIGWWHTMTNRFHFFCLVQCAKVFEWSWTSVSMVPAAIGLQK